MSLSALAAKTVEKRHPRVAFLNFMINDPKNEYGRMFVVDATKTANPNGMSLVKLGQNKFYLVSNKSLRSQRRIAYADRKLALRDAKERTTKDTTFIVVHQDTKNKYVVVPTCFPKPMTKAAVLKSSYLKDSKIRKFYDDDDE